MKRRLQIFLDKESEKRSAKVGRNFKIDREEIDKVDVEKEEGKVSMQKNGRGEEGSFEQQGDTQPPKSKIKSKIELRKRKHTIYGKKSAVINLPSPGMPERLVYRILGKRDFLSDSPQRSEGKVEQLLFAENKSVMKVSGMGGAKTPPFWINT